MVDQTPKEVSAVCFGEILWDQLGEEKSPGGAPMNVAYHLRQFGFTSAVISQVGEDKSGHEILSILKQWKIDTSYCYVHPTEPTGMAVGTIGDHFEVDYEIVEPTAWDFIPFHSDTEEAVKLADLFVYGSLSSRSETSQKTLLHLLQVAAFRVFDVNLRQPFYTQETIKTLLENADLLKLNEAELEILCNWFAKSVVEEKERISFLRATFSIPEIILTRGKNGASYFSEHEILHVEAIDIQVSDTVGSGDAFLAGFLAHKVKCEPLHKCLAAAANLAGFVTTQKGACPSYDPNEIATFGNKEQKSK